MRQCRRVLSALHVFYVMRGQELRERVGHLLHEISDLMAHSHVDDTLTHILIVHKILAFLFWIGAEVGSILKDILD